MYFCRSLLICFLLVLVVPTTVQSQPDSTLTASTPSDRQTKAKSGRKLGLIVGGAVGAGLFVLGGAASEAFCEYDCGDITPLGYIGLGVVGFGVGALTGALLGTLFGSMVPDDPHPSGDSPSPKTTSSKESIASIALQPGWGVLTDRPENESGFTMQSTLLAQLNPWLGMGPEVTYGDLAGGVFGLGGAVYLGRRDQGLRPYVVTNLGWQHWKTGVVDSEVDVLATGIGAGLSWTPNRRHTHVSLETRYHWSPHNIEDREAYRFVNTSLTLRHSW